MNAQDNEIYEYSYGLDLGSPDGDHSALTIRKGDKLFTFIGDELQAILQWMSEVVIKQYEEMTPQEADGKNEDVNAIISGYQKFSRNWLREQQRNILKKHGWKEGK